jgi:hypothetical protein
LTFELRAGGLRAAIRVGHVVPPVREIGRSGKIDSISAQKTAAESTHAPNRADKTPIPERG